MSVALPFDCIEFNDSVFNTEETFEPIIFATSALEEELSSVSGKPYTQSDILNVFSAIVSSGCGYVPYSTLTKSVGSVQVNGMIDQNIVHYFPNSVFCKDLQPFPVSSIVTGSRTPALRAMEALLLLY